jgi:hypothetical protein
MLAKVPTVAHDNAMKAPTAGDKPQEYIDIGQERRAAISADPEWFLPS